MSGASELEGVTDVAGDVKLPEAELSLGTTLSVPSCVTCHP